MGGAVRIGISGWRYAGWRGNFYPEGLAQRRELEYAASRFPTVEINGTFYSLQRPESFAQWYDHTPDGFQFSVKGGRYITHYLKLKNAETALANFFASGMLLLREKLGPILWQFPAQMPLDMEKFEAFLSVLPRTTGEVARWARRHDERLEGRAWVKPGPLREVRHAVEVRHDSFFVPAFIKLLRREQVALVVSDGAENWSTFEDVTAPFVYVRLHGSEQLYVSGYSDSELDGWGRKVTAWAEGRDPRGARRVMPACAAGKARDVYVYFDNDAKVRAPVDAQGLIRRVERPRLRRAG